MNPELIEKKLSSFLHDPIDKPFILMLESHEERAKTLAQILGVTINADDTTGADWISSAMDRLLTPKIGRNNPDFQVKFSEFPQILHPLSCEIFYLGQVPDLKTVKNTVEECMKKIANLNLNKEQIYLYLWRNLRWLLKRNSDPSFGKLWDIIPADTRVPDHTIWDHIKISCACSSSSFADKSTVYNQLSTFVFSIGPVQKFIQTARKTQDLWMGSYILSYLTWKAIKTVIEDYGPDCIIYPDLYEQPFVDQWLKENSIEVPGKISLKLPTFPNRFLAILPKDNILDVGKKAETTVREEFKNMAEEIFNEIFKDTWKTSYACEMLNSQINNFLEIFWVGLPWFSSDNKKSDWQIAIEELKPYFSTEKINKYKEFLNFLKERGEYQPNIGTLYGILHEMAEKSLGAIKNIKVFNQTEEYGRKCSLCGERDIIRFDKESSIKKSMQGWHELSKRFSKYFNENEALCSVCLVKRAGDLYFNKIFGLSDISFPSTSEVSSASFKKYIGENEELRSIYNEFVKGVSKILSVNKVDCLPNIKSLNENIDGEWLFPENLDMIKDISEENRAYLKSVLNKLTKKAKPSKYYAIIMMDGDNMGKWLSGDQLPEIANTLHPKIRDNVQKAYEGILNGKRMIKPSIHAFISSALKDFSLKLVKEIVENRHLSKLVYAGGDDVLALVNLSDLFDVMVELRAAFSGHIDKNFNVDLEKTSHSGFIETDDGYCLTMGANATASMGVVIAHYKMPLREALYWSKEMEKEAKMLRGKNAFAIALMKHSGEIRKAVSKWTYENGKLSIITLMKKLADMLNKGLSDKFIYNLREEFSRLIDENSQFGSLESIFNNELKRLMMRAKGKEITKEEINELSDYMSCFLPYMSFGNFISLLEIISAIRSEERP